MKLLRLQTWGDLILGTDERTRTRVKLTLMAGSVFVGWLIGLSYMHRLGVVSTMSLQLVLAYDICGLIPFYLIIRSGLSARFKDQAMVEQQMLFSIGVIAMGYFFIPPLRPALMQAMCMTQVFGMFSLRPNQALRLGLISVAMLVAALAISPLVDLAALETRFDITAETLRLAMSGFIVFLLALLSRHYATLRVQVREDKAELARALAQESELAVRDSLTCLYTRQYAQEQLEREMARVDRGEAPFCVALIDLDHFKQVNDELGHHTGDEALVSFARLASASLRGSDVLARWGGEEFFLMMPHVQTVEQAQQGLLRLLDELRDTQVSGAHSQLRISFSAGLAVLRPDEPVELLLQRADRALYEAKAGGRARCVIAD